MLYLALASYDLMQLAQLADECIHHPNPKRAELGIALQSALLRAHVSDAPAQAGAMPRATRLVLDRAVALFDWAREHTSPRDPDSPHTLLVAMKDALDAIGAHTTPDGSTSLDRVL